jgi:hypothetical protein
MKTSSLLAATIVLVVSLFCAQSYAQSVGIAADKQKQQNLEKNKARQKELKNKYNSLTPEQAAEAEKRANEYKRSGGKKPAGTTAKPATPSTGSAKPVLKGQPVPAGTKVAQPAPVKTGSKAPAPTPASKTIAPAKKAPIPDKK